MQQFAAKLESILSYDPGHRNLPGRVPFPDLLNLAQGLLAAERVLIITGFPIASAKACETDGPVGAAHIARALCDLGKKVVIATDSIDMPVVEATVAVRAPDAAVYGISSKLAEKSCVRMLELFDPTHIISIERPGKGADNHFHNMPGLIIDDMIADTDVFFAKSGAVKISIGDGGNEIGMGNFRAQVEQFIGNGSLVCAEQCSDYPLVAGVSNWWGWGLAALLSVATGRDLIPTDEQESETLRAVLDAGGVDGVTKESTMTVDNISLEQNLDILHQIRAAAYERMPVLV